ncbi:MAG: hypothetical protein LBC68_00825, partial [Prevotellaceae bacterium]|nr:hypothetical protein [Prevotellaceae bacterium]
SLGTVSFCLGLRRIDGIFAGIQIQLSQIKLFVLGGLFLLVPVAPDRINVNDSGFLLRWYAKFSFRKAFFIVIIKILCLLKRRWAIFFLED